MWWHTLVVLVLRRQRWEDPRVQLCGESEASLGCLRLCLKTKQKNNPGFRMFNRVSKKKKKNVLAAQSLVSPTKSFGQGLSMHRCCLAAFWSKKCPWSRNCLGVSACKQGGVGHGHSLSPLPWQPLERSGSLPPHTPSRKVK